MCTHNLLPCEILVVYSFLNKLDTPLAIHFDLGDGTPFETGGWDCEKSHPTLEGAVKTPVQRASKLFPT